MRHFIVIISLLAGLSIQNLFCQASLEIEMSGFRNKEGRVLFSLCTSQEEFPKNPPERFKDISVPKSGIKDAKLLYTIEKIQPGRYALALLDDENKSGDMDYSKLGFPLEGLGFSNNIKPILSAPSFKKCSFEVKEGQNRIHIEIQYKKERHQNE